MPDTLYTLSYLLFPCSKTQRSGFQHHVTEGKPSPDLNPGPRVPHHASHSSTKHPPYPGWVRDQWSPETPVFGPQNPPHHALLVPFRVLLEDQQTIPTFPPGHGYRHQPLNPTDPGKGLDVLDVHFLKVANIFPNICNIGVFEAFEARRAHVGPQKERLPTAPSSKP